MYRKITKTLYKVSKMRQRPEYVEASDKMDLYDAVSDMIIDGEVVSSVSEICADGTTPKVTVLSNPDFKMLLKSKQKAIDDAKKREKLPNTDIKKYTWGMFVDVDPSKLEDNLITFSEDERVCLISFVDDDELSLESFTGTFEFNVTAKDIANGAITPSELVDVPININQIIRYTPVVKLPKAIIGIAGDDTIASYLESHDVLCDLIPIPEGTEPYLDFNSMFIDD